MRPASSRLLVALGLAALGACGFRALPVAPPATPAAAVERLVEPRPSGGTLDWLGGDVASSARLSAGRWAWIFGDTLLGRVRRDCPRGVRYCGRILANDEKRAMIANSVAIMRIGSDGRPGPLEAYWRTVGGRPAPIFEADRPGRFLWPLALARTGPPLLVAASVHSRATGLFSLGSVLLRVENPDDVPTYWRYTRHALRDTIRAGAGRAQLTWATALVPLGTHVYLFGEHGTGPGSQTVLARFDVPQGASGAWEPALEYLVGDARDLAWQHAFDAARLYPIPGLPGTSETTFHQASDGRWRTYRIPPGAFEIRLYTAASLLGPWTDEGVVARIPAPWSDARRSDGSPRYAAYAVKAHPELGSADRPVLTYNVNVTDGSFGSAVREAVREPDFYVPRTLLAP
jgi:hypothetical protein